MNDLELADFKRQLLGQFDEAPEAPRDEYQRILAGLRRKQKLQRVLGTLSLAFCVASFMIAAGTIYVTGRTEQSGATTASTAGRTSSLYDAQGDLARDYDVSLEPLASLVEGSRRL